SLIRNAVLRRWRRVASVLVAPLIAGCAFALLAALGVTPERIRFELGKQYYLDQIAQTLAKEGEPRFKMFDWGSTGGAAVVNVFHTLIFDESDEIARPRHLRSAEWNERIQMFCPGTQMCSILQTETPQHRVTVTRIHGHFYLVTEYYQ